MKATGIVRRIDDLGRVVIPKEIRRTLRIREGDPLEIFTDREGEVILKKYSPIGELGMLAKIYCDCLAQTVNCTVCISDNDQIVAVAGSGKKDFQEKYISKEFAEFLLNRDNCMVSEKSKGFLRIVDGMNGVEEEIICPIISGGDVIGGLVLLNRGRKERFSEVEKKLTISAADFLGRQMEQ